MNDVDEPSDRKREKWIEKSREIEERKRHVVVERNEVNQRIPIGTK